MKVEISPLLHILNPDNTGTYNRLLAHAIGLNEAVIYASLVAKFIYYNSNDLLDSEGYFYSTAEDLQESTSLTRRQQDKVIKTLAQHGLIDSKVKGLPAKRHFKVFYDGAALQTLIQTGLTKSENLKSKMGKQVLTKSENLVSTKSENLNRQNVEENISNINIRQETEDNKKINKDTSYQNKKEVPTSGKVDTPKKKTNSTTDSISQNAKKDDTFMAFAGNDMELLETLRDFENMRKLSKKPMTERAKKILVSKLEKEFKRSEWIATLEQSIERNYSSVYPVKHNDNWVPKKNDANPDYSYGVEGVDHL